MVRARDPDKPTPQTGTARQQHERGCIIRIQRKARCMFLLTVCCISCIRYDCEELLIRRTLRVVHYWGAQAILERIGYSKRSLLPDLIAKYGLPVYLRKRAGPLRPCYYSNEAMILSWELSRASLQREQLVANLSRGVDRRYKALERKRKNPLSSDHVVS